MGPVPASLKPVQPYLNKAEEMKSADPVVSYYCTTWAIQYAISLGLKDTDSKLYLASLLDTLEKTKASLFSIDAITDDVVGKAYMENFAGNIFAKADEEERSKRATRNTATKFLAAGQFMEVLKCFGDLDKETTDKIRYSKFQCARILKALKAGEDPNKSDLPEQSEQEQPSEDSQPPVTPYTNPVKTSPTIFPPVDGNLSAPGMNRVPSEQSQKSGSSIAPPVVPYRRSSSGVDTNSFDPPAPTTTKISMTHNIFPSQSPFSPSPPPIPSQQRPSPPTTSFPPNLPVNPYSSPKPPPPPPSQFSPPTAPQPPYSHQPAPSVSSGPSDPSNYYTNYNPGQGQGQGQPSSPSHQSPYSQASAPPPDPRQYSSQQFPSQPPHFQPPHSQQFDAQSHSRPYISQPPTQSSHIQSPSYFPPQTIAPAPATVIDDEAMAKAQKHARWAISALNYEDVDTAVKELRSALSMLGVKQ